MTFSYTPYDDYPPQRWAIPKHRESEYRAMVRRSENNDREPDVGHVAVLGEN